VKKVKVTWHVAKNEDQPVSRFQIPLVPGLSSTIHVAQGTEMFPIIKLDETITPTHVFVAMTRSRRSSRCLIEPSDNFDFGVFGKGTPGSGHGTGRIVAAEMNPTFGRRGRSKT
jgi:hypothetical protein